MPALWVVHNCFKQHCREERGPDDLFVLRQKGEKQVLSVLMTLVSTAENGIQFHTTPEGRDHWRVKKRTRVIGWNRRKRQDLAARPGEGIPGISVVPEVWTGHGWHALESGVSSLLQLKPQGIAVTTTKDKKYPTGGG